MRDRIFLLFASCTWNEDSCHAMLTTVVDKNASHLSKYDDVDITSILYSIRSWPLLIFSFLFSSSFSHDNVFNQFPNFGYRGMKRDLLTFVKEEHLATLACRSCGTRYSETSSTTTTTSTAPTSLHICHHLPPLPPPLPPPLQPPLPPPPLSPLSCVSSLSSLSSLLIFISPSSLFRSYSRQQFLFHSCY